MPQTMAMGSTTPIMSNNLLGSRSYVDENLMGLTVYPREIWARDIFRPRHKGGQHVVFGGPSKYGKTELAFDMLAVVATPELPAYVAVSKPTDKVTKERGKELHFRFVSDWPVPKQLKEYWQGHPKGYVIWPHFGDINSDFDNAAAITARLMSDRYTASARSKKNSAGILVMDDTMVKAKVMGLDSQMVTILAMAGAMHIGLWIFVQRPSDSGRTALWGFENGDHFLFGKGGDHRMLQRYMQIGAGDNSLTIMEVAPKLEKYQFIYMHEDFICIVDKKP
jgi:hypothetical protein